MEKSVLIMGAVQSLIALVPTLILLWKTHEKKRANLAVRILRKKKEIEKNKIDNQATMEKLQLELKSLEEEANYQTRMSKWESGEWNSPVSNKDGEVNLAEQNSIGGLTNKLSDLKTQGGVNKLVGDLKNKGLGNLNSLKEKGLEKVKGFTDQFKQFVPDKKEEKK